MQQSDRVANNKIKQYKSLEKRLYINLYSVESFEQ